MHLLELGLPWPPQPFLQRKLESLAARGFRVTAVSVVSREDAKLQVPGVTLLRLPEPGEHGLRKLASVLWHGLALVLTRPGRIRALVAALRSPLPGRTSGLREAVGRLPAFLPLARVRPDVVHFEWPWKARFFVPLIDVWGRPCVTSFHSGRYEVRADSTDVLSFPTLVDRAAVVHCVSEAIQRWGPQWGLEPSKSRLIRPAVDPSFFSPGRDGHGPDRFRVVSVGRLHWVKGHEQALVAIRRLVDDGVPVHFELAGEGPERPRLLYTIAELGLEDHVRLRGHLSPAEVRECLRSANVLLHPSVTEGIPNAVLEAMACGLPVVVTDCGGLREAVVDGREGFVVPRRAPREMADALARLWREPGLRQSMGRAARARVEAEFTLRDQTQRYVEFYDDVAGAR